MENLVNAVRQANNSKNWFAALFLSLTLPDICGAMENINKKSRDRYRCWCERYLLKKYSTLTAEDCYKLRCACLHEGSDSDFKMAFARVHFIEPTENMTIHNNVINNILQLQVDLFCNDICEGVEQWLNDVEKNQEVVNRIKQCMNVHPISSLKPIISFA